MPGSIATAAALAGAMSPDSLLAGSGDGGAWAFGLLAGLVLGASAVAAARVFRTRRDEDAPDRLLGDAASLGTELTAAPILVVDLEGTVLAANPAAVAFDRALGFELRVGRPSMLFDPSRVDPDVVADLMARAVRGRSELKGLRLDPPADARDAAPRVLDLVAAPVRGDDGRPRAVVVTKRDVAEHLALSRSSDFATEDVRTIRLLNAILASDLPLGERLDQALQCLTNLDGACGRNRAALFAVEQGRAELQCLAALGALDPAFTKSAVRAAFGRAVCGDTAPSEELRVVDHCTGTDGHAPTQGSDAGPDADGHGHYVVPLVFADACVGVLLVFTRPGPPRDQGRLDELRMVGSVLAAALAREQLGSEVVSLARRLDAALENNGIGVWEFDHGTRRLVWSATMETLFRPTRPSGRPHGRPGLYEVALEDWISWLHPEDREDLLELLTTPPRATHGPPELLLRTGEAPLTRFVKTVARHETTPGGRCIRTVGTCQDITDHEMRALALMSARDSAEQANRAKSDFLANMSHEIRTPMTAILGYAELLEERDPETEREAPRAILGNARYLLTIINDILDMSKIEAGKMVVERIATSPHEILAEVVDLVRPRAEGKGIALGVRFVEAVPRTIDSDPVRLRQILINLLGNAVKFTESGSVEVVVSFRIAASASCDEATLVVSVRDSGIGMTPGQLEVVRQFEAFSQADATTTRRFGGTGLGLRISASLARLLGGSLAVESEAGHGSTFTVEVDAGRSWQTAERADRLETDVGAGGTAGGSGGERTALSGRRILLADDGRDNRRLISHLLRKAGAEVALAENGLAAVDASLQARASGQPYDAILMDMQMPEMDGYEATRTLARNGDRTPVIALTAHAMEGDERRCRAAGCIDYVTKPIDRPRLLQSLLAAVERPAPAD